MYEASMLN